MKNLFYFSLIFFYGIACNPVEEELITKFEINVPSYVDRPEVLKNLTPEKIQLGKQLFFDPKLSSNGLVSCATCHLPEKFFTDGLRVNNLGVNKSNLPRHSPPLFNLGWHKAYFWDGGAPDLTSLALAPLTSPDEMGADLNVVKKYLQQNTNYKIQFEKLFPEDTWSTKNIFKALEWYQLSLVSFNTQFDRFWLNKDSSILNTNQILGLKIYEKNCNSCHELPLASNYNYSRNGLETGDIYLNNEDERWGRFRITLNDEDKEKYKIPSLRNLSYTAPYMHDGRFETISDVLQHYEKVNTEDIKISLSQDEKKYLQEFLQTLNDEEFIKNN